MLRKSAATGSGTASALTEKCNVGVREVFIVILFLCLLSSFLAIHRLEQEKDNWKDRLVITLRSTSDLAKQAESRLQKSISILRHSDDSITPGNEDKDDEPVTDSETGVVPIVKQIIEPSTSTQPKLSPNSLQNKVVGSTTLIIFCYNRADYLTRTLKSLTDRLQYSEQFPSQGLRIIISQDGYNEKVKLVAIQYQQEIQLRYEKVKVVHIQHERQEFPDKFHMAAYYSLSVHYKKGLNLAFADGSSRVIILEDDLDLAIDFFPYFEAFAPMLEKDSSLLTISAWNDHGQTAHVQDPTVFYRSDFFPGLGWMIVKRVWDELQPKWPLAFWDDWLRQPKQRLGRHIIHPEVSRTITFGESGGASAGQFFTAYLKTMKLNDVQVKYDQLLIQNLEKQNFDNWFMKKVESAVVVKQSADVIHADEQLDYKVHYSSLTHYEKVAEEFGIINDVKDGVPRGAYRGIVPIRVMGRQVFLVPADIPKLL
jgi:alpha-1,3-mannosyl-glycoprotein beta-1,2-N-acetylglucosaminyltransferase